MRILTPAEVAKMFSVDIRSAQRRMASGEIRSVRFGRQLRTTPQAVQEYVSRSMGRYRRELPRELKQAA